MAEIFHACRYNKVGEVCCRSASFTKLGEAQWKSFHSGPTYHCHPILLQWLPLKPVRQEEHPPLLFYVNEHYNRCALCAFCRLGCIRTPAWKHCAMQWCPTGHWHQLRDWRTTYWMNGMTQCVQVACQTQEKVNYITYKTVHFKSLSKAFSRWALQKYFYFLHYFQSFVTISFNVLYKDACGRATLYWITEKWKN